jgi:single-stranded-DNA-specific exonuclease
MIQDSDIRNWQKPPFFSPTAEQKTLAQRFNVNPLIIHLLELRNIIGNDEIEQYLNPSLAKLPDPFTIKGMDQAALLVSEAIERKSEIIIWGDYDVDGVTSTCLLVNFFKKIGIRVVWKIPDRFSEGYGLNRKGIEEIRSGIPSEYPLLITVDCGISNHLEIRRAKELGFYIIVTDHHEPPENSVKADAILNVKQEGCDFIDKNLAGVGTAFYLAAGIRSRLKSEGYFINSDEAPNLKQFLDLVAIGSIADMVPLTGTNRILVKTGLEVLSASKNIGISALLKSSDICNGTITSDDIAFQIAPKINAAGRMKKADMAMELLLCEKESRASILAKHLTDLNKQRKKTCKDILESTLNIDSRILIYNKNCIVISGDFHQGVIGIVASKLVEKYNLPVILFAIDRPQNGKIALKGSGRSIPGIDLFSVLGQCDRFLLKYGGHTMAAGMSILQENLDMFKGRFSEILEKDVGKIQRNERYVIDANYSIGKLFDDGVVEQLQKLEPYGVGNKKPIFLDSNALVCNCYCVGHNGDHLKVSFRCKYSNQQGVGFNLGNRKEVLRKQTTSNVIYSPVLNRFKNSISWEVRVFDIL